MYMYIHLLSIVEKTNLILLGLGENPSGCHRCQAQSEPLCRGPYNSTLKLTVGKNAEHAFFTK